MFINADEEWKSDLFEFELKQKMKIWKCLIHSFGGGVAGSKLDSI